LLSDKARLGMQHQQFDSLSQTILDACPSKKSCFSSVTVKRLLA
jgi:hypothetical protein